MADYATSLQSTALTRKRPDSGAANPDIISVWKKRVIILSEPDKGESLNTSRMKQFTGEDPVEARGLFEDQQKFLITGKMFMLCNDLPPIESDDYGTWRRVIKVPFVATFVGKEKADDIDPAKNIWPKDATLRDRMKSWRTAFLARLVHVYQTEYLVNGIDPIPDEVLEASMSYRSEFDMFGKFRAERIREKGGESTLISDAYRAYKNWHAENFKGTKILQLQDFTRRMEAEFGKPADKRTYKRIIVFRDDAEVESFDAEHRA